MGSPFGRSLACHQAWTCGQTPRPQPLQLLSERQLSSALSLLTGRCAAGAPRRGKAMWPPGKSAHDGPADEGACAHAHRCTDEHPHVNNGFKGQLVQARKRVHAGLHQERRPRSLHPWRPRVYTRRHVLPEPPGTGGEDRGAPAVWRICTLGTSVRGMEKGQVLSRLS